jgi:anti-sigma factor RsiW
MHEVVRNHLEKMLEGRLPQALQNEMESHLAGCPECRQALESARETSRLLRLLISEDAPEPAPGFSFKVMQNIAESKASSRSWFSFPAVRELALAAAMFLVLLGGYSLTVQATEGDDSAQVLLNMPVERETPSLLAANHQHSNPDALCLQCWQQKQRSKPASDEHARREQVIVSLVSNTEMGD